MCPSNLLWYIMAKKAKNIKNQDILNLINVLNEPLDVNNKQISDIENHRKKLLSKSNPISKLEVGAGTRLKNSNANQIKNMTKNGACNTTLAKVLFNIAEYFNTKNILELGTQLGIGTAYLSASNKVQKVFTIEACPETLSIAQDYFKNTNSGNKIYTINNTFDKALPELKKEKEKFSLFYIDGDHRGESLLRYYRFCKQNLAKEEYIFVIDDINWSRDMFKAWKKIAGDDNALAINAGRFGLILHKNALPNISIMLKFSKLDFQE